MKVKELIEKLSTFDQELEITFETSDDVEPDSVYDIDYVELAQGNEETNTPSIVVLR
jgi:putative IMPACT (imprinted ancient) family translation regulator